MHYLQYLNTWSMINKNSVTEIEIQPEGQKSKTASHWLLPLLQSEMAILPPETSEWDWHWELSPPVLHSSLGLGLRACTTTAWFLWQISVVTGIKGVCRHCLVCKAGPRGCFTFLIFRQALLIKIQMKCHYEYLKFQDNKHTHTYTYVCTYIHTYILIFGEEGSEVSQTSLKLSMLSKMTLKFWSRDWRDDSTVKNTDCFSRGPGFNSQHPHGNPQLSVTPVPAYLTTLSGLHEYCIHVVHRHTCRQNTDT